MMSPQEFQALKEQVELNRSRIGKGHYPEFTRQDFYQFIAFVIMLLITAFGISIILSGVAKSEPLVNSTNNSLEINITSTNLKEAGSDTINATITEATKIKEKLPNEIAVKAPGFTMEEVLILVFVSGLIISKRRK